MITRLLSPVLLSLCCLVLSGCFRWEGTDSIEGSGTSAEETRSVSGVRRVSFSVPGTLYIEQGSTETLRIEADANLLEHLVTEVRDGALEIRTGRNTSILPQTPMRFYLTAASLEAVQVAGSGDVEASGLQAGAFTLSVAGSGDAQLADLTAESLNLQVAGSGNVQLSGKVRRQDLSLAGSGDLQAADLLSEEADVQIAGSGSAELHVRDRLDVKILGSGSVRYRGSPEVSRSVLGSGDVRPVRD